MPAKIITKSVINNNCRRSYTCVESPLGLVFFFLFLFSFFRYRPREGEEVSERLRGTRRNDETLSNVMSQVSRQKTTVGDRFVKFLINRQKKKNWSNFFNFIYNLLITASLRRYSLPVIRARSIYNRRVFKTLLKICILVQRIVFVVCSKPKKKSKCKKKYYGL